MSEEEKEAVGRMKNLLKYSMQQEEFSPFLEHEIFDFEKVLNLIEKQEKVIDKMAERINFETLGDIICDEICKGSCNKTDECKEYIFVCKNCIKEYFYKEIENE